MFPHHPLVTSLSHRFPFFLMLQVIGRFLPQFLHIPEGDDFLASLETFRQFGTLINKLEGFAGRDLESSRIDEISVWIDPIVESG